jgi:predicted metalloprotease with PDZ domain
MRITYILEMREPQNSFFQVTINVEGVSEEITLITMPAWTPGSYAIRDFARNVRLLKARTPENEFLDIQRKDKSTWKVLNGNNRSFTISYEVYAGEFSVRESHMDSTHAYLNGTSVFMYVEGYKDQSAELIIKPYGDWKISTGLERIGDNRFRATNYDIIADSPIEIGLHRSYFFTVDGKEHEVAIYGNGNQDDERIVNDAKKIVETYRTMMGTLPYKRYLFIIHLTDENGGGGLEHLNSTTIDIDRFSFLERKKYIRFLEVVAHEFFHLWNIKRIRPVELGPFNYKEENYTTMLWVGEGITNFYGNLTVLRAGLITREEYLGHLADIIFYYEMTPGTRYESASDSSFDAWIKLYRQSPNNLNSYVSYYLKGEILGLMISGRICEYTKGQKNLDDLFRHLMEKYNKDGKGYTEKDFITSLVEISALDFAPFFSKYVKDTETVDFQKELRRIGLELTPHYRNENGKSPSGFLGILVPPGKTSVYAVLENSPAQKAGICPKDEIAAIDGFKFGSHFLRSLTEDSRMMIDNLQDQKPGKKMRVHVFRQGILHTFDTVLGEAPPEKYSVKEIENPDENVLKIREKFLLG